jgi:ABC-type phosphate transport system substrate-binding protein
MTARARLQALLWLALSALGAVCCTQLESGRDTFPASLAGSAGDSAASGAATSAGQAAGGNGNGGAAGSSDTAAAGDSAGGADCVDETGFDGVGCYRCEPHDLVTLENACSSASCVRFDNLARLPLAVDGKLPELPSGAAAAVGAGGTGGVGGAGGGAAGAGTGVACDSLTADGTVIYVTGSTAAKPFLQQIAQQLALQKVFVVYTSVGSCTGVDAIVNGTLMRTGAAPLPASATYWDASSSKACDLPAQGVAADLGISDVFAPSCPGFELTNLQSVSIRDAHGPIQTMTFAVPANSKYSQISQQAAYLVFGFGKDGQVLDPSGKQQIWKDEDSLLQRNASSGTQAMLAAAIGVPPAQWKGKLNKSSDDVAGALQAAAATQATADATIGILGADYVDSRNLRPQIRFLAYQDSHQGCAVTPDSTDKSQDKQNVRDGHYPLWGPLHLLYKVDAKGNPQNAAIRDELSNMVGYLSGTKALPNGVKLFDVYASSGLVPECAMHVTRSADGGPIVPTRQDNPCSCTFDLATTGKTDCAECKVQGDCASGELCSQGYCEKP